MTGGALEHAVLVAAVMAFQAGRPEAGPNEQAAARKTQEIAWQESGIEPMLNEYARKHTAESLRFVVGNAAYVAKTVSEQRITFVWTFP